MPVAVPFRQLWFEAWVRDQRSISDVFAITRVWTDQNCRGSLSALRFVRAMHVCEDNLNRVVAAVGARHPGSFHDCPDEYNSILAVLIFKKGPPYVDPDL
jgi:hypothetical protein